jgi:amino acid permease
MIIKKRWVRRRFLDARYGHTHYLVFGLTCVNFVLIAYRFLIENDASASELINLPLFIMIFLILYIPVSILIGYWHRRTQLSVEMTMKKLEDPLFAKMFRVILDVQTGKATKEEVEKIKDTLIKIEKGTFKTR